MSLCVDKGLTVQFGERSSVYSRPKFCHLILALLPALKTTRKHHPLRALEQFRQTDLRVVREVAAAPETRDQRLGQTRTLLPPPQTVPVELVPALLLVRPKTAVVVQRQLVLTPKIRQTVLQLLRAQTRRLALEAVQRLPVAVTSRSHYRNCCRDEGEGVHELINE
mgnify:FL=1